MILSHQHRFIFTAIPKTGTHAVREALRAQLGPDDHEQAGLFVVKRLPYPELAAIGHGHIALQQLRPHLGADQFDAYCKFAFVRNPFDRFISYCAFITREDGAFKRDPQAVMRDLLSNPPIRHVLFWPQHVFLCDPQGRLLADRVGRVEQLQDSFDAICAELGLASAPLGRVNSSERGAYRDYYNDELVEGVRRIYRRDLELFEYEF